MAGNQGNVQDTLGVKWQQTGLDLGVFYQQLPAHDSLLRKLQEANREMMLAQDAARRLEREVKTVAATVMRKGTGWDPASLAGAERAMKAKEDLRNWVLSLVESMAYIDRLAYVPPKQLPRVIQTTNFISLATAAATKGNERGSQVPGIRS